MLLAVNCSVRLASTFRLKRSSCARRSALSPRRRVATAPRSPGSVRRASSMASRRPMRWTLDTGATGATGASGAPAAAGRAAPRLSREARTAALGRRRGMAMGGLRVDLVSDDAAVAEADDAAGVGGDLGLVRHEHDGHARGVEG